MDVTITEISFEELKNWAIQEIVNDLKRRSKIKISKVIVNEVTREEFDRQYNELKKTSKNKHTHRGL